MGDINLTFRSCNLKNQTEIEVKDNKYNSFFNIRPRFNNDDEQTKTVTPKSSTYAEYYILIKNLPPIFSFYNEKNLIKVESKSDPNYNFTVDPTKSKGEPQYRIWGQDEIEIYFANVTKFGDPIDVTVTCYISDGTTDYNVPSVIPAKIKYALTNVEEPTLKETVFTGETLTLKVESGFEFINPPVAKFDGKEINFTVADNKKTATIQLSKENFNVENLEEIEVVAVAEKPQINITYKLQYCSVQGVRPETVFSNDPQLNLTLVCDDGYIFKSNPWLEYTTEPYNDFKKIDGVISEDKTTATLELDGFVIGTLSSLTIQGTASVKPIETTIASNLTTIYNVDNDKLKDISLIRFRQPNETLIEVLGGEINRKYMIDLTSYIISLKHFFIDVPTTQEENIKIGFMQTEIKTPVVPYDSLTLDLGNIEIKGKQDNLNDYSNTVVSVYLAFIGLVTLDSVLTVNKVINVRYEVNLYNGDCQVFLTNNDNVIVYMGSCNISANIPYIYDYDRKVNNQLNFYSSMNFMQDLESYVLVRNKIPVNSSLNLTLDNKETIIGNEKGLNYFTDFQIEFIADKQEKEELKNLLENGIIL